MLRLARWLLYRDKVLDEIGTILVMYPRGRQFPADYPGMRALIREHFDGGASSSSSALLIAALVLGDIVRQLAPDQQSLVLAKLHALDIAAMETATARQISRRPERFEDPVEFATNLVGGAILMARRMAAENSFDRGAYRSLLATLDQEFQPEQADMPAPRSLAERFAIAEPPSLWARKSA